MVLDILIAGEEVASLARLGVFQTRKGFLELVDYDAIAKQGAVGLGGGDAHEQNRRQTGNHHTRRGQHDGGKLASLGHPTLKYTNLRSKCRIEASLFRPSPGRAKGLPAGRQVIPDRASECDLTKAEVKC